MNKNKLVKQLGIVSLIIIGVNAVFGFLNYKKAKDLHKNNDITVTFGEKSIDMSDKALRLDCAAMFGAMTLDFRNCIAQDQPYEVNLFAKFAGVEVIVPEGWFVESKGKIAMAGVENFTATYEDEQASVILRFNASFAGISIKNVRYS